MNKSIEKQVAINALNKSIKHYEKMIAWAKKQNKKEISNENVMWKSIGEHWHSNSCSLCELFVCSKCPFGRKYGYCGKLKNKNKWIKLVTAHNWKEWIKGAKQVKFQLFMTKLSVIFDINNGYEIFWNLQ